MTGLSRDTIANRYPLRMPGSWPVACRAVAIVALLGVPAIGLAATPASQCDTAARKAASETGVPLRILRALTRTETGRGPAGRADPWPWAVNAGGKGYWFETRQEARRFVERTLSQGRRNLDVGCFQLNVRWHGDAFPSAEAMLDPMRNAGYAAEFLRRLYTEMGDWTSAAGAYHSRTPRYAAPYRNRFARHLAALDVAPAPPPPEPPHAVRENRYPLLRRHDVGAANGSLVGLGGEQPRRFVVDAARPLGGGQR